MSQLFDFSALRRAAGDLAYIDKHGLYRDLCEWIGCVSPGAGYDPDRRHRIEYGTVPRVAQLLSRFTGADETACLAATIAELEPTGMEDRCSYICEFAALHRRHGSKFYAKLYEHLDHVQKIEQAGPEKFTAPKDEATKRRESNYRKFYGGRKGVA